MISFIYDKEILIDKKIQGLYDNNINNILLIEVKNMDAAIKLGYTVEDIYQLPEGQRAELINGDIYYMAPPNFMHQEIVSELHYQIMDYIKKKKGNCKVLSAPFAVFLDKNDKTYVEPDLTIVCDRNKITEKGCNGAPDWIIEVVSPSTRRMDYLIKASKYETSGVLEYWIIDPKDRVIHCHDFKNRTMESYTFSDKIKVSIYEDFELDFSKMNF